MHIPTREEHDSMNLGQAVAVCLYELIRNAEVRESKPVQARAALGDDVERISELLMQALEISGYVKQPTVETSLNKVRRLVRRMSLSERDAKLWLGMLRQILWKMRQR
jgi:tRNA/rRNA methyltransferase